MACYHAAVPTTFAERLEQALTTQRQPGLRGARSRPRQTSLRILGHESAPTARLRPPHHRCHLRHGRGLQTADRLLQRLGRRGAARGDHSLHPANARRTALVILDAKRGDIGNTAEAYAREAFDRYQRRRRHRQSLHGRGLGAAVSGAPGSRRHPDSVPHQQSRRQGFSRTCCSTACRCTGTSRSAPPVQWNAFGNRHAGRGRHRAAGNGGTARGASRH